MNEPARHPAFVFVLTLAITSIARADQTLTLDEAVTRAIQSHPAIAASIYQNEASEHALESADRSRSARVWASGTATQFEEPMVVTPIHGFNPGLQPEFDSTTIQASLALDYSILDGGSRRGRIDSAHAGVRQTSEALESIRQTVALQTASTYLRALTLSRTAQAQEQRLEALREEESRVRQLLEVGRAAEVDRLRVEAAIAAATAEKSSTASELDATERTLSRLTSLPLERTRATTLAEVSTPTTPVPERTTLVEQAVDSSPSIRAARAEADSLAGTIQVADAVLRPKLNFVAAWNEFGSTELSFTNEWQAGFQIRIPLWDGGAATKQVASATAAWRAAQQRVQSVRLEIQDAIDQTLSRIEETHSSIESLERAVDRYAEVARIEKLRLDLGAGTQADYLRAEADLVAARTALASARYREIIHRIELARITGTLDDAWLKDQLRNDS